MVGLFCLTNKINGQIHFQEEFGMKEDTVVNSQSPGIYNAIMKHGLISYSIELLELCELNVCSNRKEHWISSLTKGVKFFS